MLQMVLLENDWLMWSLYHHRNNQTNLPALQLIMFCVSIDPSKYLRGYLQHMTAPNGKIIEGKKCNRVISTWIKIHAFNWADYVLTMSFVCLMHSAVSTDFFPLQMILECIDHISLGTVSKPVIYWMHSKEFCVPIPKYFRSNASIY